MGIQPEVADNAGSISQGDDRGPFQVGAEGVSAPGRSHQGHTGGRAGDQQAAGRTSGRLAGDSSPRWHFRRIVSIFSGDDSLPQSKAGTFRQMGAGPGTRHQTVMLLWGVLFLFNSYGQKQNGEIGTNGG